jgi:hypothetical protein
VGRTAKGEKKLLYLQDTNHTLMKICRVHQLSALLIILYSLFSCQKEFKFNQTHDINVIQPVPVQASLEGKVLDENNLPVAGAIVKSGNNTTITDTLGLFFFHSIQLDKYSSLVTVEKAGYFKALRNFSIKETSSGFVKLKLIPKHLSGTINATNGGSVTLADNSTITVVPGSIVIKSTNQNYTGNVKVYAATIDPTTIDIAQVVPGCFQAIDSQNKRAVLKSYGMMTVELEGQNNEALQIATGKTARLHINIPSSLQTSSPAVIPLWSLDETTGLWKKEGEGIKTNGYYEGTVSHFSFWNFDMGFASIFLEFTVKTPQGNPLPYTQVRITGVQSGISTYGYTDSAGYVSGFVINYQPLRLEILNTCNETIYSKDLGQLSQNTNLGTITVTLPVQYSMQLTGNIVDCNNKPVAHGSALIYFEGQLYITPLINGNFSTTFTQCPGSSNIEIIALDSVAKQQSTTYQFTPSNNTLNTGTLTACGVSSVSFINYTYDNTSFRISSDVGDTLIGSANLDPNGTGFPIIAGASKTQPTAVYVHLEYDGSLSPGTYPLVNFSVNQLGGFTSYTPYSVTITSFGSVGQFIEGNFNAKVLELGTTFHTITGTFSVKRVD